VLDALGDAARPAAGGSAAALAGAMAAAVTSKAATKSDLPAAAAQADALRTRLVAYARDDADALLAARWALAHATLHALDDDATDERRDFRLGRTLDRAAAVPGAIAESCADVAMLAAAFHDRCQADLQADLVVSATLAAAAARAAAHLVEINLGVAPGDDASANAVAAVAAASTAAAAIAH